MTDQFNNTYQSHIQDVGMGRCRNNRA